MVAAVNFRPTSLQAIDNSNLRVAAQTGWEKFLDALVEIFTLSIVDTRLADDALPSDVKKALTAEATRMAADPAVVAEYQRMRRDSGNSSSTLLFNQLAARIRAQSPNVPEAQIRAAAEVVANALAFALSESAPVPTQDEGFNALTTELERTLNQPRAVASAQGGAFRQMLSVVNGVTTVDRSTETARDALGIAGLFTLGLTWGAATRMDRDAAAGVITPAEVRELGSRVRGLPAADQAIFGVMMQHMAEKGYVVFRGNGGREQFDALSAELIGNARPNDATTRTGQVLANLAALNLALAGETSDQSLPAATPARAEELRTLIAADLDVLLRGRRGATPAETIAPAPSSLQRLALETLRDRLSGLPASSSSEGLNRLQRLAPAAR